MAPSLRRLRRNDVFGVRMNVADEAALLQQPLGVMRRVFSTPSPARRHRRGEKSTIPVVTGNNEPARNTSVLIMEFITV